MTQSSDYLTFLLSTMLVIFSCGYVGEQSEIQNILLVHSENESNDRGG